MSDLDSILQAVYLDTLGSSSVRWHLVERILGALTKAKPELWEVMVATALDTGAASACTDGAGPIPCFLTSLASSKT